jgi:inward rectifier potassium channel
MRQHYAGIALHGFEIAAPERRTILRWGHQFPRPRDQAIGVGWGGRLFKIERLIDQNDELGKVAQPLEPWVAQYQVEKLSGGCDPLNIPFIRGPLGIEQNLVELKQSVAQRGQSLRGPIRHRVHRNAKAGAGWRVLANLRPIPYDRIDMQKPSYDPGLTQRYTGSLQRVINKDGSFNVRREGATWRDFHPYLQLINMRWPKFLLMLFLAYVVINSVFATAYYFLPPGEMQGIAARDRLHLFFDGFFFSAHTLTTVGYGNIAPVGMDANLIASLEALIGVLSFAIATGLLFGRFSRPSARIGFSDNMLISPYQEATSLQFRVVNRRANSIIDLQAQVLLMTVTSDNGEPRRSYTPLKLERERVLFLPLTWTVVHPIDQESPLWNKTSADLARLQAEALILIRGHDDTFNQTVIARYSYRHDEVIWGARFAPAFHADEQGELVLELPKVGELASSQS